MPQLAVSLNAARQIDQKLMNAAKAHECAGFDCVVCSWRTDDVEKVADIIETETNLPGLRDTLEQLDHSRTEIDTAMASKGDHPLAHFHLNGSGERLHAITVKMTLFNRIRAALGTRDHDTPESKSIRKTEPPRFILRPLNLPQEARSGCHKCNFGAIMASESAREIHLLCYVHVIEIVMAEQSMAFR